MSTALDRRALHEATPAPPLSAISAVPDAAVWSISDYLAFLTHSEPEIRAWAARRVRLLHPAHADAVQALEHDPCVRVRCAARTALTREPIGPEVTSQAGVLAEIDGARASGAEAPDDGTLECWIARLASDPSALRELASSVLTAHADAARAEAVLYALEDCPERWATQTILEHLPYILRARSDALVWQVLAERGDPAALPAVLEHYRVGDRDIAYTAWLLASLARREEDLPTDAGLDAAAVRRLQGELEGFVECFQQNDRSSTRSSFEGPLALDLRCSSCQRTHSYEVPFVFIDPTYAKVGEGGQRDEGELALLGRVITCSTCRVQDAYTFTAQAMVAITARLMAAIQSGDRDFCEGAADRLGVVIGHVVLHDGTRFSRPSEGMALLRQRAEAEPQLAEPWRRLGNLCARFGCLDEAREAFKRAVAVGRDAEAAYALALQLAHEQDDEAWPAILHALELMPGSDAPAALRNSALSDLLDTVRGALPRLHAHVSMTVAWSLDLTRAERKQRSASHGSERKPRIVCMSRLNLRTLKCWDRLAAFLASDHVLNVVLGNEAIEETSELQERIDSNVPLPGESGPPADTRRFAPKAKRNDPCPCGSGRKYKKCCIDPKTAPL